MNCGVLIQTDMEQRFIVETIRSTLNHVGPDIRFKSLMLPDLQYSQVVIVAIGKNAAIQAYCFDQHVWSRIEKKVGISYYVHQIEGYVDLEDKELNQFLSLHHVTNHYLPHPKASKLTFETTSETLNQLSRLSNDVIVVFLISGGGSAAFASPDSNISERLYGKIMEHALREGFDILELNYMRSIIDRVKGGRTLNYLQTPMVYSWVTSDVVSDDPRVVASGPTTPGIQQLIQATSKQKMLNWLADNYNIDPAQLQIKVNKEIGTNVNTHVITTRMDFINLLSEKLVDKGYNVNILDTNLQGEVIDTSERIFSDISTRISTKGQILIWAGEPTVTLSKEAISNGKGGRVASITVLVGEHLAGIHDNKTTFVALATDGNDGSSPSPMYIISPKQSRKLANIGKARKIVYSGRSAEVLEILGCGNHLGFTNVNLLDLYLALIPQY